MAVRDELVREIEITDRLLAYRGYGEGLRRRLIQARAAMLRELTALDAQSDTRKPSGRAKVIEFPGKAKVPRKIG